MTDIDRIAEEIEDEIEATQTYLSALKKALAALRGFGEGSSPTPAPEPPAEPEAAKTPIYCREGRLVYADNKGAYSSGYWLHQDDDTPCDHPPRRRTLDA